MTTHDGTVPAVFDAAGEYLLRCQSALNLAKNRVAAAERNLGAYRRDRRSNAAELAELESARSDAHAEFKRALTRYAEAKGPCGTRNPPDGPNFTTNQFNRDLATLRAKDEAAKR